MQADEDQHRKDYENGTYRDPLDVNIGTVVGTGIGTGATAWHLSGGTPRNLSRRLRLLGFLKHPVGQLAMLGGTLIPALAGTISVNAHHNIIRSMNAPPDKFKMPDQNTAEGT